ncbi:MuF-C-terminal domain-containing protein [Acinetobacter colistiniresistens]|uniref:MuF-C-terminal domain-containing protein n=1 Tax=Acinetobacter colistiniresistens TaxID=280145 RepID=UPI00148F3987|nr:hypothetical protein [Acinetobacter colistiniresistens]
MNALERINLSFELTKIAKELGGTDLTDPERDVKQQRASDIIELLGGEATKAALTRQVLKGRTNNVKTAKGTKVSTVLALMEIDEVIASHNSAGAENPLFPQELQPRDRSRESSQAWVQKTSNSLDPESLGRSGRADTGAPIIGPDNVVESGNGRTMAIQLAYERGQAEEYKNWLIEEADYFGFTAEQVESFKQPILVRIRTSEIDRIQFTVEANQDDKLSFTATERAKSDAKRLDDNLLGLFAPGSDGDLLTASNQKFIQGFLKSLGETEAAQYMTTEGKPTQALVTRIKAAMFSKAYNDDRLLEMMADQTKPELQNMLNALGIAAPKFIEAQAYSRGDVQDVSSSIVDGIEQTLDKRVANAIIEAANAIMAAKNNDNQDITEYVKQLGLFGDLGEGVPELAVFLAKNGRSAKKMGILFKAMAEFTERQAIDSQNIGLFGDPEPVSIKDALNYGVSVIAEQYDTKTADMFDSIDSSKSTVKDPLTKVLLSKELLEKISKLNATDPEDPEFNNLKTRIDEIVLLLGGLNEKSHSPFQKAIDDVLAGNTPAGYIALGNTPAALKLVGLPDAKFTISGPTIEKVMAQHLGIPRGLHSNIHNLTPDTLRQLPQQINDPIAIFKSGGQASKSGFVVLTELIEKDLDTGSDKPVIAALHVKQNKKGIDIINIASVYGRSNTQLQRAFTDDLLYINNGKGQQFLNTNELLLPRDVTSDTTDPSQDNIKTEADLKASIEFDAVTQQYKNSDKWMKAPNGENTNLTEKQWVQVRTPSFKKWFGDWEGDPGNSSNRIDENGEPRVEFYDKEKNQIGYIKRIVKNPIEVFLNIRNADDIEVLNSSFISVKNKKNIKSANHNRGTYDDDRASILDSLTDLNEIDEQAHNAATSPLNDEPEPTEKQKIENDYKTGDFKLLGLNICIENPEGSIRAGIDENGDSWSNKLTAHYGYIDGTIGIDGDEIDCFVKPGTDDSFDGHIYIIDQVDQDGELDEHKVIIGAEDRKDAKNIYLSNYADDWNGLGQIRAVTQEDFKDLLKTNLIEEENA